MKTEFSVLMSVYNEKETELRLAIDSVLNQSFTEFEFIIVCDNPNNDQLKLILSDYEKIDRRIKIVWNKENIGLALALNAGFMVSQGKYLIRMDADDICEKTRFEKQVEVIKSGKFDLIWSSYDFIDENGRRLNQKAVYYNDLKIPEILPYENVIHHPTVVMTKKAFVDAGMYRNYPCAQDYDLWLRMLENGCRMHMMEESLLQYRVRETSVTNKRKYQQLCTLDYIRYVSRIRIKYGKDIYSYEGYLEYIKSLGVGNTKIEQNFKLAQDYVADGKKRIRNHNLCIGVLKLVQGMIISDFYRKQFILTLKRKWIKRI